MPELPDLEAIREYLNSHIRGQRIVAATVRKAIVLRMPPVAEFIATLTGRVVGETRRRGKFLLVDIPPDHTLAINPMLTGRVQHCPARERVRASTCLMLALADGSHLRYYDDKVMGKVYLVRSDALATIPRFDEMAPDALDPSVTLEVFRQRLRRHPGMVKNILTNDRFLAGIGNAYADEVLFEAGVHPWRPRPRLADADVERLYRAIHTVLEDAKAVVAERMGARIDEKVRDFLKVHSKGGQPCPRCGHTITQITARQRLTNYCRRCQS
ncbi:MAG: hypothetical protein HY684_06580 [Chloroflexi bacterium]|nr:hypothetical protein [Chloroflexota bacterium]